MEKFWNIANIITLIRILLILVVVQLISIESVEMRMFLIFLTILIIFMDSLDGWVARKLKIATRYGAVFDIVGDRLTENIYWLMFAVIGIVPIWVPIIFLFRSFFVDSLRADALARKKNVKRAFDLVKTNIGKAFVSSNISRSGYGFLKALSFALGIYIYTFPEPLLTTIFNIVVVLTVALCIIRGVMSFY